MWKLIGVLGATAPKHFWKKIQSTPDKKIKKMKEFLKNSIEKNTLENKKIKSLWEIFLSAALGFAKKFDGQFVLVFQKSTVYF